MLFLCQRTARSSLSSTWLATAATVKVYVGGQQPGMAVKAPSNVLSAEIEVAGKEVPLSDIQDAVDKLCKSEAQV